MNLNSNHTGKFNINQLFENQKLNSVSKNSLIKLVLMGVFSCFGFLADFEYVTSGYIKNDSIYRITFLLVVFIVGFLFFLDKNQKIYIRNILEKISNYLYMLLSFIFFSFSIFYSSNPKFIFSLFIPTALVLFCVRINESYNIKDRENKYISLLNEKQEESVKHKDRSERYETILNKDYSELGYRIIETASIWQFTKVDEIYYSITEKIIIKDKKDFKIFKRRFCWPGGNMTKPATIKVFTLYKKEDILTRHEEIDGKKLGISSELSDEGDTFIFVRLDKEYSENDLLEITLTWDKLEDSKLKAGDFYRTGVYRDKYYFGHDFETKITRQIIIPSYLIEKNKKNKLGYDLIKYKGVHEKKKVLDKRKSCAFDIENDNCIAIITHSQKSKNPYKLEVDHLYEIKWKWNNQNRRVVKVPG